MLAVGGTLAGTVLSGSFAVELVTSWPGLGRLTVDALMARDADLAAGCTLAAAAFLGLAVLAADVALAAVDPRVRSGSAAGVHGAARMRRLGIGLVAGWIVVAILAPWLAPYEPTRQFADHAFAPPTPLRVTRDGRLTRPYFLPAVLRDPLRRVFDDDRAHPVTVAWLTSGRLFTTAPGESAVPADRRRRARP